MKIKEGFTLKTVAGACVVLPPASENLNFGGMLSLNPTGRMLWLLLEEGLDRKKMAQALTKEFDVSLETAQADVDAFLDKLLKAGCIEF